MGHSSSAYSFDVEMPSGRVNAASLSLIRRTWHVRCTQ